MCGAFVPCCIQTKTPVVFAPSGCKSSADSPELSDGCNACRVALDVENNKCIPECPEHKTLTEDKKCVRE